jgi:hypothetical protein
MLYSGNKEKIVVKPKVNDDHKVAKGKKKKKNYNRKMTAKAKFAWD